MPLALASVLMLNGVVFAEASPNGVTNGQPQQVEGYTINEPTNDNNPSTQIVYTVKFNSNGGATIQDQTALEGTTLNEQITTNEQDICSQVGLKMLT